jgi:hypothetical protein
MKTAYSKLITVIAFLGITAVHADEKVQIETTIIKGNKELPQILYIVPWRDMKEERRKEQQLVLHSLYGDLFDPVYPDYGSVPAR